MLYEISHRTTYEYEHDVSLSHHLARLTPRDLPRQRRLEHVVESIPRSATRSTHLDHFGNTATFLTVEGTHQRLEIKSRALVEVTPMEEIPPDETMEWEKIRDLFATDYPEAPIEVTEFAFESPLVPRRDQFASYAQESFAARRPILAAASDLNARIHQDFTFDARATAITTPVGEFFRMRRGVCQDFAHFMIACLRSLGLPARYVSGYIETQPAPGQPKLAGADASHAWVSLWSGQRGWVDLDPTNDLRPSDRHITIGLGRDFSDVSPLRGVIVGSGNHKLSVAVDVMARP